MPMCVGLSRYLLDRVRVHAATDHATSVCPTQALMPSLGVASSLELTGEPQIQPQDQEHQSILPHDGQSHCLHSNTDRASTLIVRLPDADLVLTHRSAQCRSARCH